MSQASIAVQSAPVRRAKHLRPPLVPDGAITALAHTLASVHRSFSEHVAHQEERAGYMACLARAAPRYLTMLDNLRVEHQRLGGVIAALRVKLLRAEAWQRESLVAEADAVMHAIADHDALESEMLRDALECA
jgi:hypothetical protein